MGNRPEPDLEHDLRLGHHGSPDLGPEGVSLGVDLRQHDFSKYPMQK